MRSSRHYQCPLSRGEPPQDAACAVRVGHQRQTRRRSRWRGPRSRLGARRVLQDAGSRLRPPLIAAPLLGTPGSASRTPSPRPCRGSRTTWSEWRCVLPRAGRAMAGRRRKRGSASDRADGLPGRPTPRQCCTHTDPPSGGGDAEWVGCACAAARSQRRALVRRGPGLDAVGRHA